jgi:hypothetical protein
MTTKVPGDLGRGRALFSAAEEALERLNDAARHFLHFLLELFHPAAEQGRIPAVHFADPAGDLIDRQVDLVSGAGGNTAAGRNRIGDRANGRLLHRDRRAERLGRVTLRRLHHHLRPYRKGEGRPITVRDDGGRLIEADPDAAGHRAGEADKPRILEIVGCPSLAGGGKFEA